MAEVVAQLQALARDLLTKGAVKAIVGYGAGSTPERTTPLIVTDPERVTELVWNKFCLNNLALYLTRSEVMKLGKVAVVVKGCDARAIIGLIQEGQVVRDQVVIIGMACDGVGEPILRMCQHCDVHTPKLCDHLLGAAQTPAGATADTNHKPERDAEVARLEAMPAAERWAFWQAHFSRCVKCYACRQACPLCYCKRCVVEKNQPQWIASSAHASGNFAWHLIRAMHLAGRCIGCEACERACPQDIPLSLLNRKMAQSVAEHFAYRPGYDPALPPAVKTFDLKDDNAFFR